MDQVDYFESSQTILDYIILKWSRADAYLVNIGLSGDEHSSSILSAGNTEGVSSAWARKEEMDVFIKISK